MATVMTIPYILSIDEGHGRVTMETDHITSDGGTQTLHYHLVYDMANQTWYYVLQREEKK